MAVPAAEGLKPVLEMLLLIEAPWTLEEGFRWLCCPNPGDREIQHRTAFVAVGRNHPGLAQLRNHDRIDSTPLLRAVFSHMFARDYAWDECKQAGNELFRRLELPVE